MTQKINRGVLVALYIFVFLVGVAGIFVTRLTLLEKDEIVINSRAIQARPFALIVISVFFLVSLFATILMYMNFFLLENPKFDSEVVKGVDKEIKDLHKKRLMEKKR